MARRVAFAIGVFPYLKGSHREECFNQILHRMHAVGSTWTSHEKHGELLRSFRELGGLIYCPPKVRRKILHWLVLTYIGTVGGVTMYGNVRHVFYSDTAAPIIIEIITQASELVAEDLRGLANDKAVKIRCSDQHIARRYEALLDLVDTRTS